MDTTTSTRALRPWIRPAPDPLHGIREFIVGTGGESLDTVIPGTPNLQAWADQYYGVLKLTLRDGGYAWDYESALESPSAPAGTPPTYSDTGSGLCRAAPGELDRGCGGGVSRHPTHELAHS